MQTASTIGIIGIGNMGLAMALRLRDAGWVVCVRDLVAARTDLAAVAGARVCASPAEIGTQCGLVIVAVVDAEQAESVLFGSDGAAAVMAAGACVMLCPTIGPASTEALTARLAAAGLGCIDAPMSGGPARARDGSMSLMVACTDALFERHRAVIERLSSHVFRVGSRPGDGARTKLVNNLLAAVNLAGAAEALALAERVGLDAARSLAVIEQSSGQSWIGSDRMPRALAADLAPRAHTTLLAKDSALALAMARQAGAEPALGQAAAATFAAAVATGYGSLDDAGLLDFSRGLLRLTVVRELTVDPADHPRRQPHISSASGLVEVGDRLWVVADDEQHLAVFGPHPAAPLRLVRLLDGDLPATASERKAAKRDLEVLMALPARPGLDEGGLLALGSGSRPNRCVGVWLALAADGQLAEAPRRVDLAPLYAPLAGRFAALNIEGGWVSDGTVRLLQRGNDDDLEGRQNACVTYDETALRAWLGGAVEAPPPPIAIDTYRLGRVHGVALGFTDGAALPGGGWLFSAVAEATGDAYADGPCLASVIGVIDTDGRLGRVRRLAGAPKVEGLSVRLEGGRLVVLAVTDGDDPARPSQLLRVEFASLAQLTT